MKLWTVRVYIGARVEAKLIRAVSKQDALEKFHTQYPGRRGLKTTCVRASARDEQAVAKVMERLKGGGGDDD